MFLAIQGDTRQIEAKITAMIEKQLPFASAMALNDTAEAVRKAEQKEMESVFDRPTPYTLNAFFVQRASKNNLVSVVERKPQAGSRHYLEIEQAGGVRGSKAIEQLLAMKLPTTKSVLAAIPAEGAKLDRYGNWSQGEISKVLADFGANRDIAQNKTAQSWKRKQDKARAKGKTLPQYFIPQRGLTQDIYMRDGKRLRVILHLLEYRPSYRPLFDFYGMAEGTASATFQGFLLDRLAEAASTAK